MYVYIVCGESRHKVADEVTVIALEGDGGDVTPIVSSIIIRCAYNIQHIGDGDELELITIFVRGCLPTIHIPPEPRVLAVNLDNQALQRVSVALYGESEP